MKLLLIILLAIVLTPVTATWQAPGVARVVWKQQRGETLLTRNGTPIPGTLATRRAGVYGLDVAAAAGDVLCVTTVLESVCAAPMPALRTATVDPAARWTSPRLAVVTWPADAGYVCVMRSRDGGASWWLMDCDDDGDLTLSRGGGDAEYAPAAWDLYRVWTGQAWLGEAAALGHPPGTVWLPLVQRSPGG